MLKLKKEFRKENKKLVKVAKLKKIKQREKTIEEFVQKFQKVARNSKYKERILIKEFKREINETIKKKLIDIEKLLTNIK